VFVLPSLAEGHPKALLEAMSCGAACVVSTCEGNRSVIEAGKTALVHEPSDVRALADAIERILTDPSLRADISRRAREHATARFDIMHALDATNSLLYDVAARRGRLRAVERPAGCAR
jgi:glycosyltransferase involved in cell wall biosynthesis